MPYDTNGTYKLPSVYLAEIGQTILIEQHNDPLEDIQGALNQALLRDGSVPIAGNLTISGKLTMGGHRITGLADGVNATDAVTMKQALVLASTSQQTVSGPVTFSETTLVPSVTDWTKKQAVPASDADARYVQPSMLPFTDRKLRFQIIRADNVYDGRITIPQAFSAPPVFVSVCRALDGFYYGSTNFKQIYIAYDITNSTREYIVFSVMDSDNNFADPGMLYIMVGGYF